LKKALITGITGQDGSYLAELLLQKGYKVYGFVRNKNTTSKLSIDSPNIEFCFGDLCDFQSICTALQLTQPDEIYNLASQSHPGDSWHVSLETGNVTGLGAHRLFEAARQFCPQVRIFQASSSEVYGNVLASPQNEETPFNPINPYGVAKVYAQHMANIYKQTYGLFIACGILFNHESPRRGMRFVTQKVTYGAACAKLGITHSSALNETGEPIVKNGVLSMGNLFAKRDWGYAPDYVDAMYLMLQKDMPETYVIGTGISHTIEDLCHTAFSYVGHDWKKFIVTDERFMRPVETKSVCADPQKAVRDLDWHHKTTFEKMIQTMVDAHLENLQHTKKLVDGL